MNETILDRVIVQNRAGHAPQHSGRPKNPSPRHRAGLPMPEGGAHDDSAVAEWSGRRACPE